MSVKINLHPTINVNVHMPLAIGRGGGVAAIVKSRLLINPIPKSGYSCFESFALSPSHSN